MKDQLINEWNSRPEVTHKLAHNIFSDKTDDETKRYRGFLGKRANLNVSVTALDVLELPESINWLEKGAVTPVQN